MDILKEERTARDKLTLLYFALFRRNKPIIECPKNYSLFEEEKIRSKRPEKI